MAHIARDRMLAEVPGEERRLRLAGAATAVLEAGDGPPLILLHGGIECGGAYWAPVIGELAARHRVIVPDVPGLGESEPLGLDRLGEWFAALVAATCRERPALVAHSLLGSVAPRFAADVGRLIVYAAPGVGPYRMPVGLRMVAVRFGLRPTERNAERFERWAFSDFDRFRLARPDWLASFDAYMRERAAVPHVKRTMRALIRSGTRQVDDGSLRRIAVPAALLWGRHDRFVPLGLGEAASTRLGWPLHVVDDAGHVPHIERPEAFLSALDQMEATA